MQTAKGRSRLFGGITMTKARTPAATVTLADEYCAHYRTVFSNVRHFEQFSQLVSGLLAPGQTQITSAAGDNGQRESSGVASLSGQGELVRGSGPRDSLAPDTRCA